MGYLMFLVLIVVGFIIYLLWADFNKKRNLEESRKKAEEELKARKQKSKMKLKPMQDRMKFFLKSSPGETFSENELRKHLEIITASEENLFFRALLFACAANYGRGDDQYADSIEGVVVFYKDGQRYAYYVDPRK